ncbi:MAG: isoprenylcysteine carboxylmethyltransferase family protein, partial [Gammaproteobacteria bacterium]|nr:isoprenylcysteine carboxylmethyltransferase family protein [Gammaproteobacteria bacterium]
YKGREYSPLEFATPWPYKVVRHPLYLGWLCAFWFTPTMSVTHLVFATVTTAYILFAVRLEENDLADAFDEYEAYQRQVPMLIPRLRIASQVRRALALAP